MSKPILVLRRLTVSEGRNTIGFIAELWNHEFSAEDINGESLGLFATTGAAAQAINDDRNKRNTTRGTF